jgi:two-component system NtrC family response regulator
LRHRPEHESIKQVFAPETIQAFEEHPWPGNVRELANVIEYATILCDNPPIELKHLPKHFKDRTTKREQRTVLAPVAMSPMTLRDMEAIAVQEAIARHNGNKPAAAEELGISLKTLYNKLNQAEPSRRVAG